MIKVIGFTSRPGVSRLEDFLGGGSPIAPDGPGVAGSVVAVVDERTRGTIDATAWVEQWWTDEATFQAWLASSRDDGDPVADGTYWLTKEHVLRSPAVGAGAIKLMGTAYRRADFSMDAFFRYWRDVHGPISAIAPGLGGYVVTEVVRRLAGDVDVDGFVEQWWPDARTLAAANDSPEVAVAWADVANYAQTTGTFWLTHEVVSSAPPFPRGILEAGD